LLLAHPGKSTLIASTQLSNTSFTRGDSFTRLLLVALGVRHLGGKPFRNHSRCCSLVVVELLLDRFRLSLGSVQAPRLYGTRYR
jgi:hypothetical protein